MNAPPYHALGQFNPHQRDEQDMLGGLDMMFAGPSVKDGLTLGAITEDPREDMISEFTVSHGCTTCFSDHQFARIT